MRLKLKQQPWLLISALTVGSILLLLQFLPILHLNDFKNILSNSDLPQSHHNQYSSTQTSNHQRQAHIETGKPLKECIPEKYRELFSNLPEEALSNWHKPRLHLQIITFNRPQSLNRLLDSLLNAEMMCDELSITFHVEANADADSLQLINSFFWPFGPKTVHRRIIVGGLMSAIVESWYPGSRDDYTIILEDDIEVSSLFYIWAKLTLLRYRYSGSTNPRLFGVSLYTPRLQEMTFPRKRFIAHTTFEPQFTPFLWQLPCSWGAIYFPEHWQERLRSNLSEIVIPNSRSNFWRFSWKKYFIEMIVLRGYFMLYPNFMNQSSFSTNHLEPGIHISAKSKVRLEMMDEFRVPLMASGATEGSLLDLPELSLPAVENLPIIDLFAAETTLEQLVQYGRALKPEQHSCEASDRIVRDFNGNFTCVSL